MGCLNIPNAPVSSNDMHMRSVTCEVKSSQRFGQTNFCFSLSRGSPFAGGARSAAHEGCSAPEAVACHRPADIQTSKMVRRRLIQHELRGAAKGCGRQEGASASTATLSAARIAARRTARALRDRRSPVPS